MTIPVVQAVAVKPPYKKKQTAAAPSSTIGASDGSVVDAKYSFLGENEHIYTADELRDRRQNPDKQYNDVIWAILFCINFLAVVSDCVAMIGANVEGSVSFVDILFVTGICGLVSVGLCAFALRYMMRNAESLVHAAIVFSVGTSLALGILGLLSGNLILAIVGCTCFALGCSYAYFVWNRIPFAAANLKTAVTAVKANMGLTFVAYVFIAIAFVWSLLLMVGLGNAVQANNHGTVFFFFLSYYWTHQVLQNTMHVTTAGVIGTWWFVPSEANQWWSQALTGSLVRATTYSFGSICFGSFLVGFVQAFRTLEHYARGNDCFSLLVCIIQCMLGCIQSIMEFMNRWAYIYVGLYGFSYIEAGRNVITLFQNKGFTVVITDDLASNVLFMITAGIGLATGLVGLLLGLMNKELFVNMGFHHGAGPGFLVGFLVGYLFAAIFMGVVDSGIATVIVLYVEAPEEFQMNYPELSAEMRAAWVRAWPELYGWSIVLKNVVDQVLGSPYFQEF